MKDNNRLIQAQKNLDQCFVDLEDTILAKIDQIKNEKLVSEDLDNGSQSIIRNLNEEINSLNKSLSQIALENESLILENKQLRQELSQIKLQSSKISSQIKNDLSSIRKIINLS
jgi:predicted RNase H-like nuclease (RuvC/YqgF family)